MKIIFILMLLLPFSSVIAQEAGDKVTQNGTDELIDLILLEKSPVFNVEPQLAVTEKIEAISIQINFAIDPDVKRNLVLVLQRLEAELYGEIVSTEQPMTEAVYINPQGERRQP